MAFLNFNVLGAPNSFRLLVLTSLQNTKLVLLTEILKKSDLLQSLLIQISGPNTAEINQTFLSSVRRKLSSLASTLDENAEPEEGLEVLSQAEMEFLTNSIQFKVNDVILTEKEELKKISELGATSSTLITILFNFVQGFKKAMDCVSTSPEEESEQIVFCFHHPTVRAEFFDCIIQRPICSSDVLKAGKEKADSIVPLDEYLNNACKKAKSDACDLLQRISQHSQQLDIVEEIVSIKETIQDNSSRIEKFVETLGTLENTGKRAIKLDALENFYSKFQLMEEQSLKKPSYFEKLEQDFNQKFEILMQNYQISCQQIKDLKRIAEESTAEINVLKAILKNREDKQKEKKKKKDLLMKLNKPTIPKLRVAFLLRGMDDSRANDVKTSLTSQAKENFSNTIIEILDKHCIYSGKNDANLEATVNSWDLGEIDCFFVSPFCPFPSLLGDYLHNAVQNGKGLVLTFHCCAFGDFQVSGGIVQDLPLKYGPQAQDDGPYMMCKKPKFENHPILRNVLTFNSNHGAYRARIALKNPQPNEMIQTVAFWPDHTPFIVTKYHQDSSSGKIVFLNIYPPSSRTHGLHWDAATDGDLLMQNSLIYASKLCDAEAWSKKNEE